jgi:hypothetical protein
LRPGARIEGEQPNWDALHAVNRATLSQSYGVYARSYSSEGRGAYGYASATTGSAYGVYGRSDSSDGAGVYAQGKDAGADLVLAGNAATSTGDDGRIFSDPDYPSSDIVLVANDNIRIDLDQDGDGEDADFEIYDGGDTMIFGVDESGAVTYGGTGIAAFPRPAYDSGWVSVSAGNTELLTHNLGGNVDKYVVDFACKVGGNAGIRGIGGDYSGTQYWGAYWDDLTSSQIELVRWPGDSSCPQMRVRIWMYP